MLEELKKNVNKTAISRSICGLLGAGVFSVFIFFNLFGLDAAALARWRWIALSMCALVAVASAANWVRAAGNSPAKDIEKFCKSTISPKAAMARLEKTWHEGTRFKTVRMDSEYIICIVGMRAYVIPLKDVFWAYKYLSRTSGIEYARFEVVLQDEKRHSFKLNHDQAVIDAIIHHITENCPSVITGYSDEMEKLYRQKDMMGLRQYALLKKIER